MPLCGSSPFTTGFIAYNFNRQVLRHRDLPAQLISYRSDRLQIQVSARHGNLDDSSREKIEEKVERLIRLFDRLTSIHVTVDMAHLEAPEVEIRVTAEGHEDFVCTDAGSNVYASLDGAIHKMEGQLRKHKEKRTGHRATSQKHLETPVPQDEED
ncbi:MAG: ribosome-associated translation inhibitor RaiA [Planctomycetales bacterium]|nr:ribosome-associated translation inhibitor RaiA [Planctomycetales bacterium]